MNTNNNDELLHSIPFLYNNLKMNIVFHWMQFIVLIFSQQMN